MKTSGPWRALSLLVPDGREFPIWTSSLFRVRFSSPGRNALSGVRNCNSGRFLAKRILINSNDASSDREQVSQNQPLHLGASNSPLTTARRPPVPLRAEHPAVFWPLLFSAFVLQETDGGYLTSFSTKRLWRNQKPASHSRYGSVATNWYRAQRSTVERHDSTGLVVLRLRRSNSENLLLRCLRFDLLNHNGLRTASLIKLAACGYFVSGERQKASSSVHSMAWCRRSASKWFHRPRE